MNRQDVEKIITEYLKPIFAFALKRCRNNQDAEDLSQEIVMKVYRALLVKDNLEKPDKYIWTIAHNTLSNYYRDTTEVIVGVPFDVISEGLADPNADIDNFQDDDIAKLQQEIAYLSRLQRQIVIAYYFENLKQADIAEKFGIPLGTVKWHLFESKKELKRGMDTMRKASELKFNPIKCTGLGISGSVGTKDPVEYFSSALVQNICYCVRNTPKTVNQIADDLGVSPVYVEAEIDRMEEYGFIKADKDKYIADIVITEYDHDLIILQDDAYKNAAEIIANGLYDEIVSSGILNDPDIMCWQSDDDIALNSSKRGDSNFILWSIIPYVAALAGENSIDNYISFEEVAAYRSDGGYNIYQASIIPDTEVRPDDFKYVMGPMWNTYKGKKLWQIDHKWSDRGANHGYMYQRECNMILSLFDREYNGDCLSKDEYAWLAERGYVKTNGDYDGQFKSSWQVVILQNKDIESRLLAMGDRVKERYKSEIDKIKAPYVRRMLDATPEHKRKTQEYFLQHFSYCDGWFLLHCIKALLNNNKLQLPTKGQKRALTTLIVNE